MCITVLYHITDAASRELPLHKTKAATIYNALKSLFILYSLRSQRTIFRKELKAVSLYNIGSAYG